MNLADEKTEVQRVLESPQFRRAPKLQRFLELVCDYHFQNKSQEINELLIATQAFGRSTDFNPSEDSLVRVQAREARRRLREYYDAGGRENPLRLEIPVGGYAPVFTQLHPEPVAAKPTLPWLSVRAGWLALAFIVVIGVAIAVLPIRDRTASVQAARPALSPNVGRFWDRLLQSDVPTVLVLSNPEVGVCPPYDAESSRTESRLDRQGQAECPDEFTGMGEALALHLITTVFQSAKEPLLVKQSRMVNEDDITRYNLILLGGKQVNVWTRRLGADLELTSQPSDPHPFTTVFDHTTGQLVKDRAMIALRRHPGTGHWLLFFWGRHSQGTHAAAEAATDEHFLSGLAWPSSVTPFPDSFRVLVSATVNDGIAEGPVPVGLRVP